MSNQYGQPAPGQPAPGQPGAQVPGQPQHAASGGQGSTGVGWKIATGLLALSTIGLGFFTYQQNQKINDLQSADQAQIALTQQKLKELQAKYDSVDQKLQLDNQSLAEKVGKIKALKTKYEQAQQTAAAAQATMQQKLDASQAQVQLATACANVMATGLTQIYNQDDPTTALDSVVTLIDQAAADCQGVVKIDPVLK